MCINDRDTFYLCNEDTHASHDEGNYKIIVLEVKLLISNISRVSSKNAVFELCKNIMQHG